MKKVSEKSDVVFNNYDDQFLGSKNSKHEQKKFILSKSASLSFIFKPKTPKTFEIFEKQLTVVTDFQI